jgi:hypothetical protein
VRRLLYITSVIVTLASIILSVILIVFTTVDVQVGVIVGFTPLILSLGYASYSAIRLQIAEVDDRRFGSLPLQQLTSVPELEHAIVSIVGDTAAIKNNHGGLMFRLATEQADDAAKYIRDIADGTHICTSDDELRLVRMALEDTKRRVRAVAARGAAWWERPEANAYWHAYEAAAHRLEITRVFIVYPGEDNVILERVLERHARAGMKTFVIDAGHIPEHHIRPLVLFDESLIHRQAGGDRAVGTFRVEFSDRPEDLLAAEESFRVIFDIANETQGVALDGRPVVYDGDFAKSRGWNRLTAVLKRSPRSSKLRNLP